MNIQVNDLAPLGSLAVDAVSAGVALIDAIDNANEIISSLLLHSCSSNMHECSDKRELDALVAELATIERTARHLTQHL